jgi:exodeoxyribonuclease V alpha subunit
MARTVQNIRACVTEFLYKKGGPDNWRIAQVLYEGVSGLTPAVVKGKFPMLAQENEWYSFEGSFVPETGPRAKKGDEFFKFFKVRPDLPTSKRGAVELFRATFNPDRPEEFGIDIASIKAFVERYGDEVALRAEDNPEILLQMSKKKDTARNAILRAWAKRVAARKPIRFLKAAAVSDATSNAIIGYHRDASMHEIESNPYGLIKIKGVNFQEIDKIGRHLKISPEDHNRIAAGLLECITQVESDGHTYVTTDILEKLKDERKITWDQIVRFSNSGKTANETGVVISPVGGEALIQSTQMARFEFLIAKRLATLLKRNEDVDFSHIDAVTERVLREPKFARFDEIQKAAVKLCAREPISILTGGPGTGKSTVTEAIVKIVSEVAKGPVRPMAPTGKAAVRLSETTGRDDVQTVHSALEASGDEDNSSFKKNKSNPFEKQSVIVIDEASMLDTRVCAALLDAITDDTKIILVGDRFQIPSVSPGQIFSDLITTVGAGGVRIPCAELINVYRSQADSEVATGAVELKNGTFDIGRLDDNIRGGLAFYETRKDAIVQKVIETVRKIKADRRFDPLKDVAILSPMREYAGGTHEINRAMQVEMNPKGQAIPFMEAHERDTNGGNGPAPRIGDRVILTKNNTQKKVANGDVGIIRKATLDSKDANGKVVKGSLLVEFDSGKLVSFTDLEAKHLQTAYAITGHKSQGSQYACVILPLSTAHSNMYSRTLLYTMWTRTKNNLFLIGEEKAFVGHMKNIAPSMRSTRLPEQLKKAFATLGLKPSKQMLTSKVDLSPLAPMKVDAIAAEPSIQLQTQTQQASAGKAPVRAGIAPATTASSPVTSEAGKGPTTSIDQYLEATGSSTPSGSSKAADAEADRSGDRHRQPLVASQCNAS